MDRALVAGSGDHSSTRRHLRDSTRPAGLPMPRRRLSMARFPAPAGDVWTLRHPGAGLDFRGHRLTQPSLGCVRPESGMCDLS